MESSISSIDSSHSFDFFLLAFFMRRLSARLSFLTSSTSSLSYSHCHIELIATSSKESANFEEVALAKALMKRT
jgi:hypothetical protein